MKRNNYFIMLVLLFVFLTANINAQHVNAGPDQFLCNDETEVTLHGGYSDVITGRYRVDAIPFNWIPIDATSQDVMVTEFGVTSPLRIDDNYSDVINLPFPINFYGNVYDKIVVGSNGDVVFEASVADSYDSWSIDPSELIPNQTLPYWDNSTSTSFPAIMGAYHDIDIGVSYPTEELKYMTVGTAPNRKFVIIYENIPHFSSSCHSLLTSQEIVLNEADSSVEVHIKNKPVCSTWNDGLAVLGIQNEELLPNTCGNYPGDATSPGLPNRNTGDWEVALPEAYKFVPDPNPTYNWFDANNNLVATGADVTIPINATTTYTLEVIFEDCHGNTFSEYDDVTVTILPQPDVPNLPQTVEICQGESKVLDGTVQNASDYSTVSYEWVDDSGSVVGSNATYTVTSPGTYTLNVTLDGNCVRSYDVVVNSYQSACHIPQAISPNGDGSNDQWFLDFLANTTGIEKVEIFDRRGVLVYDKENYVNEFVGKNNDGKDLPAATYFYVIKLKDGQKLAGWLYITR